MSNIALKPDSADTAQRNTKIWLVVSQVLASIVLVLPTLLVLIGFLFFLIVDPAGTLDFAGFTIWHALIIAVLLFIGPVVTILCSVIAWRAYNKGLYMRASILTSIPIVFFGLTQVVLPAVVMFIAVVFWGYRG